ncbi:hypothetical protein [Streptomyces sp. NPDC058867]|uniref:hypothetical protein n=1 Tax=unclassified Streptomyces TaxID=2593676 RepID=UPI0036B893AE
MIVSAGETLEVTRTTRLSSLAVHEGAVLVAPEGQELTLTVDGVETGSVLDGTYGMATVIAAGTYSGDVVLTPTAAHIKPFYGAEFHLRQAVLVGKDGVVKGSSVLSAVRGGRLTDAGAKGVSLMSTGEAFNGVYVTDGASYTLTGTRIRWDGNGRNDFSTYGTAVTSMGAGTRVVLDGADIRTRGMVRTAVTATSGGHLVVKNSQIHARDGIPRDDYAFQLGHQMMSVPWMLGLEGNNRATMVYGSGNTAAYVNSELSAEKWGVLSTDLVSDSTLAVINCTATVTGSSGYGTFSDGATMHNLLLGTDFTVPSFVGITGGGHLTFDDSSRETVAALNDELDLRLTARELAALEPRSSVIESAAFGVMLQMWDGGSVHVGGGTRFSTGKTLFLVKGKQANITVDGSQGARVSAGNGVLVQVMETDDPGRADGVYTEPTEAPVRDTSFDTTAEHASDVTVSFTDIEVSGDFYNAMRDGKNLVITLDGTLLTGVVSAAVSRHAVSSISAANWDQLNHVTNTAQTAVNNGVLLELGAGSLWTVSGTSYLTKLVIDERARVRAAHGKSLTLTVDGTVTALKAGVTYTGAVALTVA